MPSTSSSSRLSSGWVVRRGLLLVGRSRLVCCEPSGLFDCRKGAAVCWCWDVGFLWFLSLFCFAGCYLGLFGSCLFGTLVAVASCLWVFGNWRRVFAFFLGGAFASAVAAGRLFPVPRGRFFFWEEVRRLFTLLSTTSWSVGMSALGSAAIAAAVAWVAANVSFFAHLAWTLAAASCCC